MTEIRLYNTKTRQKEVFAPLDPQNVRMYVCGPTVYDRAHLGNARPVVVFDVLYRLLRHAYGADHVTYVRNFTDVDDKINARAAQSGRPIGDITAETTQWFLDDMGALGALEPDAMPRATQYIPQMVAMIETLIKKGYAYVVRSESNNPPEEYVIADRERLLGEHALFEVDKYEHYGQLSGQSLEDMIAGARGETAPGKRNPMDFVLWKPSSDDLPGWGSPWGRGRPGWHIECSAMAKALLGDTFDIHGGGRDLMFPHHENEIAQSCCANDTDRMAQVWMHNEMLQVEGKKMSKSLGNFFTVRDLLDQGVPGEVIRFVFLSTHYRKPMDWTEAKRFEAEEKLRKWHRIIEGVKVNRFANYGNAESWGIVEAVANDLNTPLALKRLETLANIAEKGGEPHKRRFKECANFLGLLTDEHSGWVTLADGILEELAYKLGDLRDEARKTNDYTAVDAMKSALVDAGVEVRMSKNGIGLEAKPNFDPAKLEALK